MPLIIAGLALIALGIVAGAVWYLRTLAAWRTTRGEEDDRRAREILACWNDLAVRLAGDIDEHGSRLQEIYQELEAANGQRPATAVAAVAKLIEDNAKMRNRLTATEQKLHEQTQAVATHAAVARTDALTKLVNRGAFDEEMCRCLGELQCSKTTFTLLMIDVDRFKSLNDMYGHLTGDEVLYSIAQVLGKRTRASDVAARYGGDEFTIILSGTPVKQARKVAESIRATIEGMRFSSAATELHVTASIGMSEVLPGDTVWDVVQRTDAALYAAKNNGRNCVCWHDGQTISLAAPSTEAVTSSDTPCEEAPQRETASPRPGSRTTTSGLVASPGFDVANQTGVCGRDTFRLALGHRLAELGRTRVPLSVILIRIDDFYELRDAHGSHAGSIVLQAVAKFFTAALRDMDWVARLDTTTFAVLLPGTGLVNATGVAERLRTSVAQANLRVDDHIIKVAISTGIAEATGEEDGNSLMRRAEAAMEIAVSAGGNCSHSAAVTEEAPVPGDSSSEPVPVGDSRQERSVVGG